MKLCKDCKHFDDLTSGLTPRCLHEKNKVVMTDYLYGEHGPDVCITDAIGCRHDDEKCGPDANWFEPK